MQHTGRPQPHTRSDTVTNRHEISAGSLGWRDLPVDATVSIELEYTVTHLERVSVRYDGCRWAFDVTDPVRGTVVPTSELTEHGSPQGAARAIRGALDQVGVRVLRGWDSNSELEARNK